MSEEENLFIDYRKYYENIASTGNMFGVYTVVIKTKYPKLFAIYCFFCFFFIMGLTNLTQYLYALFETLSVTGLAECLYIANTCANANVKSYYLFRNRKDYKKIFEALNIERFQPRSKEAMVAAKRDLKLFFKVKTVLTVISCLGCLFSVLIPLYYEKKSTVMTAWFPFDGTISPLREIVYVWQGVGMFFEMQVNFHGDILASGLMTFIVIQCDLLCYELKNDTNISIGQYVEYHKQIIEFTRLTQRLFSKIFIFEFFAIISSLCMTFFLMTLNKVNSFEFFFLTTYISAITGLFLVASWYSSELCRKSENIPIAAYLRNWTDAPKSFKKDLAYFIHRTQEPIQFKAVGLFNISIQVFLKIMQSSFSYYTMLKKINVENEVV